MGKFTTEEFIRRSKEVHGDKYDYSESIYINSKTKVTIICPKHGRFFQPPGRHKEGKGCQICSWKKPSTAEWIGRAKEVHGDRYDYSLVDYQNNVKKISIICQEHGVFKQPPNIHLKGHNCHKCAGKRMTLDERIQAMRSVHGDFYDYSLVEYKNSKSKVTIVCPDHGEFRQVYSNHLTGHGCPKCVGRSMDSSDQIGRFKEIHGNKYDYSLFEYAHILSLTTIVCPDHGKFQQTTDNHLRGSGCQECAKSGLSQKEEQLAEYVESLVPIIRHDRNLIDPQELDILVPDRNTAIEFNGIYWHSEKFKDKNYHHDKWKACQDQGFQLIQVWEDQWVNKKSQVKAMLASKLGCANESIYARNCKAEAIESTEARKFLEIYHIQGAVSSSQYVGLLSNNDLIGVCSFMYQGNNSYCLNRFATSKRVVGGFTKCLSFFIRNNEVSEINTFADLCVSDGSLYRNNGWKEDKLLRPDYMYLKGNKREHKFNYRISRFRDREDLAFEEGLTETGLAKLNGLLRIYDAGKIRFTLQNAID